MAYTGYGNLRVLVVDDFDSFRMTVSKLLQEFGVEFVDTAVNGMDALKRCDEKVYDLVLCDYNLGGGKNGQQILEELRHNKTLKSGCLFILISAETSKGVVMSAYDAEPDAYLGKPITAKSLKQRLDRLLVQRDEMGNIKRAIDDGQLERAITICEETIASGSRYTSSCQKLLGGLYLEVKRYDLAENTYRQVLEMRPLDWAKVGMAKVKQAQGDFETAEKWLKDIISDNPLCLNAYDVLADLYKDQEKGEKVQEVLEQAVNISPGTILRQQVLANTAEDNNDLEVAAEAYRRVVKLGEHSCHDKVENHISFGRTTAALFNEDEEAATNLSRDAVRILHDAAQRFGADQEQKLQSLLLETQIHVGQGNPKKAEEQLSSAESLLDDIGRVDVGTELDFVQALTSVGKKGRAKEVLANIVERNKENEEALVKIDRLLEEPLSEANRLKVAKLNKEGIGLYEKKKFKEAIGCFKSAKRLFPNHIGVHLNLVQVMVGEMKEFGYDGKLMDSCLSTMKKVEKQIGPGHDQLKRYLQLQEMVRTMPRNY